MKFEPGKFYAHGGGRQIAVLGEVDSYKWGKVFVIEEADKSGHGISVSEVDQESPEGVWVEIGRDEWMRNFENASCTACGRIFQAGDKFVPTNDGPLHIECFNAHLKERGPELVQAPVH
ncbi:MAG: hypothetical protein H8E73_06615 [Planctomycetes bacterium]|nr:hypothetical protein [Planctomycetota bacterium]